MSEGELYVPEKRDSCKWENYDARLDYLYSQLDSCIDPDLKLKMHNRINELEDERRKCRYRHPEIERSKFRRVNKSKLKGKIFALFNLRKSKKFVAFYSVSFPAGFSDDNCYTAWNSFLTACRKRFALNNYVWVCERQKNKTIHYHMLTNDYMDVKKINRVMAIIIDNIVASGAESWGNSSLDKYNGVDVDSIYGSKRHKKTGKFLNQAELRKWLTAYITKYVTKNSALFTHQAWHLSRSISQLFTSMIFDQTESYSVTKRLPRDKTKYIFIKSDYVSTWVFLFVPSQKCFTALDEINNYIFDNYP